MEGRRGGKEREVGREINGEGEGMTEGGRDTGTEERRGREREWGEGGEREAEGGRREEARYGGREVNFFSTPGLER